MSEIRENSENRKYDFLKGTVFGMMLAAIFVMVFLLINVGTIGRKKDEKVGAEILTSSETARKLSEIAERIQDSFLYEEDGELLETYLFKGLTIGLKDPYASYYTDDEIKTIAELNEGEYHGIGITLLQDSDSGQFWIAGIYEGSPADTAGLQVDDEIIQVDGETVEGMDLTSLVAKIKQQEQVTIKVLRGEEEVEVTMEVTDVEIPTVSWEMLENQIGYIKIEEFDGITVSQFEDAVEQLKEQGTEGLVLDIRDNPGGTLDAICQIMDDLLPEGLIVYTEDKYGERQEYTSDADQIYDGPLAVLVNGNSASASEIFAGSIQDYGLGPIIGTTTYGKGVVQRTFMLSDGSALKLTVEKYYTAGGQDIDGNGITPDYIVEEAEETDSAEKEESIYTEEQEATSGETKTENIMENDPQLQKAVEYLMEENG